MLLQALCNLGQIRRFLASRDLEIWWMTLKNNRAPLLSNIKPYASFHRDMRIQTGVTVRRRLSWVVTSVTLTFDLWPWPFAWTLPWSLVITPENFPFRVKKRRFILNRVTFKLNIWPWKTIGHLFYDTLSFVHHFNAIGKFKLKLQSGNAQFGTKSTIFWAVWPWNFTDDLEKQ